MNPIHRLGVSHFHGLIEERERDHADYMIERNLFLYLMDFAYNRKKRVEKTFIFVNKKLSNLTHGHGHHITMYIGESLTFGKKNHSAPIFLSPFFRGSRFHLTED